MPAICGTLHVVLRMKKDYIIKVTFPRIFSFSSTMKILVSLTALFCLLVFGGYKLITYKSIKEQETIYQKMNEVSFKESPRHFADSVKMDEQEFWTLIDASKAQYPDNPRSQMQYLINGLSEMPDAKIQGFEFTFKEQMVALWDYNVKAIYQITEGDTYMSSDDFLYFRAYLISLGKDKCKKALLDTDNFDAKVDRTSWSGEELLSIADRAYLKKNTRVDRVHCPRCIDTEVSYNMGVYKMTGKYIHPDEFDAHYPKLTALY